MSVWLTEKEYRQAGAQSAGLTLNVAFLRDIKQDNRSILCQTDALCQALSSRTTTPRQAVDQLTRYRDAMETCFALEEFYGYFKNAAVSNPAVSKRANDLRHEHEQLFMNLNQIVDLAEQIMYHECSSETTLREVRDAFRHFASQLQAHEQSEMELMMRMCNEELGVGD
jgi:hypothetical protein